MTDVDPELVDRIETAVRFGQRYGRLAVAIDLPDVITMLELLRRPNANKP